MEFTIIIDAKNKLEEILGKDKLEEKDFEEIEKILNELYKKETTAKEINSAKISKTFKNILQIQNDKLKDLTNKIIKHWKNNIFAAEKKSGKIKDPTKLQKETEIEENLSKNSLNIDITSTLDLNENSINEDDKIKFYKNLIFTTERDPTRRNTKILLYEGFLKSVYVKAEKNVNPENIFDLTNEIESKLYDVYNLSSDKKDKYLKQTKSIVLSLYNNIEFVKEIFEGILTPEKLSIMDQEEMASKETKNKRQKLKEEAFNSRRSDWNLIHASTKPGIYRCGKCKSNRTTYYQAQIRRADEPMTTFITCLECTHSWKQ